LPLIVSVLTLSACPSPSSSDGESIMSLPPEVPFFPNLDVPYVPTPDRVIDTMLELTQPRPGEHIVDLGCGDGRIILTALRRVPGLTGFGVDLDPARIRQAQAAAASQGLSDRVVFLEQNLFDTDISKADVVTLYLLPEINERLRPVIFDTLRAGTRITSHDFDMTDWPPETQVGFSGRRVYFWVVPAPMGGRWTFESEHPVIDGLTFELVQGFQFVVGATTPHAAFLRGRIDGNGGNGGNVGNRGQGGHELRAEVQPELGRALHINAQLVAVDRLEGLVDLVPFSARRDSLEPIHLHRLDRDLP